MENLAKLLESHDSTNRKLGEQIMEGLGIDADIVRVAADLLRPMAEEYQTMDVMYWFTLNGDACGSLEHWCEDCWGHGHQQRKWKEKAEAIQENRKPKRIGYECEDICCYETGGFEYCEGCGSIFSMSMLDPDQELSNWLSLEELPELVPKTAYELLTALECDGYSSWQKSNRHLLVSYLVVQRLGLDEEKQKPLPGYCG